MMNKRLPEVKLVNLDEMTRQNVEAIHAGEYTIAVNDIELENILNCFPKEDTKDWRIEKLSNDMWGILPKECMPKYRKEFERLLKE